MRLLVLPALAVVVTCATLSAQVAGRPWSVPRTPDGHPDLQGFWTNDTVTPLERPAEFGDKEILTPEEAAAYAKKRRDQFLAQPKDNLHYDDAIWQDEHYTKDKAVRLRTSLVSDPRNGKLPPLTADARKREAARVANRAGTGVSDSAQTRSLAERCISWGNVGPPMIPPTYYANFQILQSRDAVVISHELMHDTRIIHLDGRAHPPSAIRIPRWTTRLDAGKATRSSSTRPTSRIRRTSADLQPRHVRRSATPARCTSSSGSPAWTRTQSTTTSPSRIRPRGQGRGRVSMRFARFEGPIYRVRLPRRELRAGQHPSRAAGGRCQSRRGQGIVELRGPPACPASLARREGGPYVP